MKRSRVWMLLALFAVALLTSGCFQIRAFTITPKSLAANGVAQVKLSLYPVSTSGFDTQRGYVVLLVGTGNIDYAYASNFDLTGNWGGPVGKWTNDALRDLMLVGGVCQVGGIDAAYITGLTWRAVLSTARLGVDGPGVGRLNDVLRVNLGLRAPADAAEDERGNVLVFSGVWDDGPLGTQVGVPEAGDVACTGLIFFSIPYRDA